MMSPQYAAYVADTIALTRSLCIKNQHTIDAQNKVLIATGYPVIEDSPQSWKYYLNLTGQYHDSESPVTIISSDTHAEIIVTSDIWDNHPISKIEYGPRGIYHRALLRDYPSRRELILRFFNPVNVDSAIAAVDYTILAHDDYYINKRESTLLSRLQCWLYSYVKRWDVRSMAITDGLYVASMLSVLYHAIPLELINIRLLMCGTVEVADFHMWSYLGSRYHLERFRSCLNNKQALYLYRNIDYLRYHVGKESTMLDIQEHITLPVNILAERYDITQSDITLISERKPHPLLLRTRYQDQHPSTNLENRHSVEHGYSVTTDAATYNETDLSDDTVSGSKLMQSSVIDTIPTGLVELTVVQAAHEQLANPEYVRAHHALYMASVGRYVGVLNIDLGVIGDINIKTTDACILLTYMYSLLHKGSEDDPIASILVNNVIGVQVPGVAHARSLLRENIASKNYAERMLDNLLDIPHVSTVSELTDLSNKISFQYYQHWMITEEPFSIIDRSTLRSIMLEIYRPYLCRFDTQFSSYREWLQYIDFPKGDLTDGDILSIISTVIFKLMGIESSNGVSTCHLAAMEILKLLSSYGIIFTTGDSTRTTINYEYPNIEYGEMDWAIEEKNRLDYGTYSWGAKASTEEAITIEDKVIELNRVPTSESSNILEIGISLSAIMPAVIEAHLDWGVIMPGPATTISEDN